MAITANCIVPLVVFVYKHTVISRYYYAGGEGHQCIHKLICYMYTLPSTYKKKKNANLYIASQLHKLVIERIKGSTSSTEKYSYYMLLLYTIT